MQFSRQEHWSELPLPPPGDLPKPGIDLGFPTGADSLPADPPGKPNTMYKSRLCVVEQSAVQAGAKLMRSSHVT